MKLSSILAVLTLLTAAGGWAQAPKPDPKFHVFLCFGQSNMEAGARPEDQDKGPVDPRFQMLAAVDNPRLNRTMGHWYPADPPLNRPENNLGPVDFFGRTIVAQLPPEYRVGVINVSVAGARIELWQKDIHTNYLNSAASWMQSICKQYDGNPYQRLVDMARIAQQDGVIRGILLHQGESNPNDQEWCQKVKGIYDDLVRDLNLKPDEVPLLAGELVGVEEQGKCAGFNTAVLANLPKVLPNAHIISSHGCKGAGDGLHFALAGFRELGKRYAFQMLRIQGWEPKEPAAHQPAEAALPAAGSFAGYCLDGQVRIHDPSTIIACGGKFYTFGTGGTALVSDDGWTWRDGARASRSGMAPDLIQLGDRYCQYVARNIGAQPRADINLIWSRTLDPNSSDYGWEEGGVVASSDGVEDCNAIDPGVFLDPNDGRLWLVYGSYFGYIRLVELDSRTGTRVNLNDQPVNLAVNCEAAILIFRDGWYYLLATHGSCCRGADSGYNIRVGRAREVVGPYVDHEGTPMLQGGGRLFVGSGGRFIGPGHFGLLDLGEGVQRFSCHYEADLDRGGASVLDIRPLLWKDGWPVAGENFRDGIYQLESVRTGTALELAVEGVPVGGRRPRGPGAAGLGGPPRPGGGRGGPGTTNLTTGPGQRAGGAIFAGLGVPIPPQDVAQVSTNWPAGNVDIRMANYLCQAQQKWSITAVTNAGGYPGAPYFKITIAGTDRTLAATEDGELIALPAFTGAASQLWRLDQLTDGTWRIGPKSVPNTPEPLVLSAIGSSSATLARFEPSSDRQRWVFKAP